MNGVYATCNAVQEQVQNEVNKAMAAGDFTPTLEVRQQDEIGVLAQALNGMLTNLHHMFSNVADSTQMVTGSSMELVHPLGATGHRGSTIIGQRR